MFSAGPDRAWPQEASHDWASVAAGGRSASHAVRPLATKEEMALQKKHERANTTALWVTLELLAPIVGENKGLPGYRSKALRGRAKEEILRDAVHAVRLARGLLPPSALEKAFTTPAMALGALQQAYTTQAGGGLIAIELKSGKIVHQSPSFEDLTSWIPVEARGNIRVSLEAGDGDNFHSFCQSVVRDAGELYGETFLGRDNFVGMSITVRFLTRAPGPPGLRNPEWLLMMRSVKLTLVGVQPRQLAGESPAAVGVFTADLSGGTPQQWTLQVAHVRYLLDLEVASGTYEMSTENQKPLEQIATLFNFEFSKEEGVGASVFSRAVAQLGTRALSIAQRSASWLTSKALRTTLEWTVRLGDDDTVSASFIELSRLFGGLSTSVSMDFEGGKLGLSHGGLDFFYFVADPEQPLDANLRAAFFRIASDKTGEEFDVHLPFVMSVTWGSGNYHTFCKSACIDQVGKKMVSEEDVSELFEKLKVSPGGGASERRHRHNLRRTIGCLAHPSSKPVARGAGASFGAR